VLGLPIPQHDPFTDIAGVAATILGEGASSPAQVQNAMESSSFVFGTYAGLPQDFPTTTGCGASPPPPPAPTTPTDSPPPPAPAGCTSYTQKSVCQENGCVWTGKPKTGSCGGGESPPTDSPPPPSPGGCTNCSGLGGGACKSCPNCSWGGNRGCNPV
jgi:hypothetical protein